MPVLLHQSDSTFTLLVGFPSFHHAIIASWRPHLHLSNSCVCVCVCFVKTIQPTRACSPWKRGAVDDTQCDGTSTARPRPADPSSTVAARGTKTASSTWRSARRFALEGQKVCTRTHARRCTHIHRHIFDAGITPCALAGSHPPKTT